MDDSGDSAKDLFITQSSFKLDTNTQDAEDAANFFLDDNYDPGAPEVVRYLDFSNEPDKTYTIMTESQSQEYHKKEDETSEVKPPAVISLETQVDDGSDKKILDPDLMKVFETVEREMEADGARFGSRLSDDELAKKRQKKFAGSSERKGLWAFRAFQDWVNYRNMESAMAGQHEVIPCDLLLMTTEELNSILSRFICEMRKKNNEDYPSETLYDLLLSLQLYLKHQGRKVRFLDDDSFEELRNTLDNCMKDLSAQGKRAKRESAAIITVDQEEAMWQSGVLGEDTPKQLSKTLLYLVGMHFALRAGQEHRNLCVGPDSQIRLRHDEQNNLYYLEYSEDVSKTNQGGLDHKGVKRKVVRAYENKDNPDRCIVHYWKKHNAVRPKDERCPTDFYLRPLNQPNADGAWFAMQAIGRVKLSSIVAELAKEAGISGKVTNHSLRATCASHLYRESVDEQLICEKTGHRSNAVRSYKRTSEDQMHDMSNILYGNKKQKLAEATVSKPEQVQDISVSVDSGQSASNTGICINVHVHLNK